MQNSADPQTPEEKRKDTSLPGREEEVIVNTEEQQQVTNLDETNLPDNDASTNETTEEEKAVNEKKTFKEGLADNSNTEAFK